jgi:endoglucanase
MKKYLTIILFSLILSAFVIAQQNPFNRGVNLTGWFQTDSAKRIQFTKYTKKNFQELKSLGVDVVRLPINLHSMTNGSPAYTLNPLFLFFLDQVVDWAEELQINLILDNHTFDVTQATDTNIAQVLIPVWIQMALHYKNRSNKIYYEVLNEPHGITDAKWNQIQQTVVTAIRTVDSIHTIIVGPANWNSYNNLSALPVYSDTNLIYTFHFYDPFLFTHQGASWTDLGSVSGIPFPYNAQRMPVCPPALQGTWVQSTFNSYNLDGTVQRVQNWLNSAANFKKTHNVPIFCGEYGVYIPNSPDTDRVYWYQEVRSYMEEKNIPWTIWDYQGGFGLFKKNSNELFDNDLNIPLLSALGFTIPPQTEYIQKPDTTGFELYSEYIGENISSESYSAGTTDYYFDQSVFSGKYCIYWNGANQYQQIGFDFKPNKDLSYLKEKGYVFECRIKGDVANTSLNIRFIDTKTDNPSDHPWRMRYIINNSIVNFNSEWQHLQIPLRNFSEHGSWDNNTWYTPIGLFDWKNIDRFEIVAEDMNLTGINLWFDDIRIYNPKTILVLETIGHPASFYLGQNYPNPFNPTTNISFSLPSKSFVSLKIVDLLGREATMLANEEMAAGNYTRQWNAGNMASGVYFYQLRAGTFIETKKLILLK